MKIDDLETVKHPIARARKACVACQAFAAECLVPVGEGAVPMCWLCAHHIVEHAAPLHEAPTARCECLPEEIYPAEVTARRVRLKARSAG